MARRPAGVGLLLTGLLAVWTSAATWAGAEALPARLSDQEFWALVENVSEPNGFFRSDNLVSDEKIFAQVVPDLLRRPRTGGVYLGVGPEQNFTYIAAVEPRMAFVIDIRRGNLHTQLLYKALFEMSADRADFLSRLFTKKRPEGLTAKSTADEIMTAYWNAPTSKTGGAHEENLKAIQDHLTRTHTLPLSKDDLDGIAYVYYNFYWHGPSITWDSSATTRGSGLPTFSDLVRQADASGRGLSFLATEARFSFVKRLQAANLVVPVVGNFAGPKAVRAVGQYVRDHGAAVNAFYVSEVEAYLVMDGIWPAFCANAATLPVDGTSVFIRPALTAFAPAPATGPGVTPTLVAAFTAPAAALVPIAAETRSCRAPGAPTAPR